PAPEPSLVASTRERGQRRDPDRRGRQHQRRKYSVRGEEAVGLGGPAEMARDDHAHHCREPRLDGERCRRQRPAAEGTQAGRAGTLAHRPGSVRTMTDTAWTEATLEELRSELGDAYRGRTVVVTGADGFMGSHLTDALVELGANVHAFVRATSSGALNNIWHLRDRLRVHFADLTDKTSIDFLVREVGEAPDKPYLFHLGAQAHVGESWHRPYETVMANTVGTLNLLQSIVDSHVELEKFDTAGTSEEYGNVRETVAHHHDFDDDGGLILHERSPINPKSIYATSKAAADFLTMNYHDVYGQGKNISMADWASLILRIGEDEGYWSGRELASVPERFRPGASDVMALRVGFEKLQRETGWQPAVSWEEGIARTIDWYARN